MASIVTDQIGQGNDAQTTFEKFLSYAPSSLTVTYFTIYMNSTNLSIGIGTPVGGVYPLVNVAVISAGSYDSNTRLLSLTFITPPTPTDFISIQYQTTAQTLSFQYRGEGRSAYFNTILHKLLPMGIYSQESFSSYAYSYADGNLSRADNSTVTVSPFIALLRDTENNLSVRLEVASSVNVAVTPATPYIICRINWQNTVNNTADVVAVASAAILDDYVVIGRVTFDINDYVTTVFDYSRRDHIDINHLYQKQAVPFRLKQNDPPSDTYLVMSGEITFSTGNYAFPDDTVTPVFAPTTAGRVDLLYIDQAGALQISSSAESGTPVTPSYDGKFVIAEIRRIGSWTTVEGQHIWQINPDRYFSSDTSNPTFNTVTILSAPTLDSHAVRKDYVDNLIHGIDWQESVINFLNFVTSEPAAPSNGDRYIATTSGVSSVTGQTITADYIYQWSTTNAIWTEIVPDNGTVTLIEATSVQWLFNGAIWIQFSTVIPHNNLSGLDGGSVGEYFHLTSCQHSNVFYKHIDTTDHITQGITNLWYSDILVNNNAYVSCAYNHAIILSGNPHGTLPSQITGFQSCVSANTDVAAAYAHSQIILGNPHNTTKTDIGLSNVDNVQQIPLSQKGVANGVATLGSDGLITSSQLPTAVQQSLKYIGTWDASTNTPTLPGSPTKGDYYVVSVAGNTTLGVYSTWYVADWAVFNGSSWDRVKYGNDILSINGYSSGAIILTTSDIAEGTNLYYTDVRVSANLDVIASVAHITADGSSHSLVGVIQNSISDLNNTGLVSWEVGTPRYSILGTNFNLAVGGTGRIKGAEVTFVGAQSVTIVDGFNLIYINSLGTLVASAIFDSSYYEDYIVLFRVHHSTNEDIVMKDYVSYKYPVASRTYIRNNVGSIIRDGGANIYQVTVGDGTLTTDRGVGLSGNDILDSLSLETVISTTSPISFAFYYDAGTNWERYSTGNELPMYYNSAGTMTAMANDEISVWSIFVCPDDGDTLGAKYIGIADENLYANSGAAKDAIKNHTIKAPTGSMSYMGLALLGYVVIHQNALGGYTEKLFAVKDSLANINIPQTGSDFITDDGTLTYIASNTEIVREDDDPYIILRKTGTNAGYVKLLFNSTDQNLEITYG